MTIQDILDWVVDCSYEIRVWEESTGKERKYDLYNDSDKDINSFEFQHRNGEDYLIFNID